MSASVEARPKGVKSRAHRMISSLHGCLRALKLYPPDNEVVQQLLAELNDGTTEILNDEGLLKIELASECFFVNEVRLELDLSNYTVSGSMAQTFKAHEIGGLEVVPGVEIDEWVRVLSWLLQPPADSDPFSVFADHFLDGAVQNIAVFPVRDQPVVDDPSKLEAAKLTYGRSVHIAKKVLSEARLGRAVSSGVMKRAAQGIVDEVMGNGPAIITMTTLRDFDDYTFTHSVNVAIFATVIGQELKLTRMQLYDLALCAFLHDLGKVRIPSEILNKPGRLDDEERARVQEHPMEGMFALYSANGIASAPFRAMLVAYEHHMRLDGGGYPVNKRERVPGLFSRIVSVADSFDAATSKRVYASSAAAPDRVLQEMREDAGYDPLVVRALINATGVFPVGSVVILDTYELGIVARANPDKDHLHQPVVRVISDEMGNSLAEPYDLDLSRPDPERPRTIVKTTEADRHGIVVSDYLLR